MRQWLVRRGETAPQASKQQASKQAGGTWSSMTMQRPRAPALFARLVGSSFGGRAGGGEDGDGGGEDGGAVC